MRAHPGIAIAFFGIVTAACERPTQPEPAAEYHLLFVSAEGGALGQDIFRMNADGTGRENLTRLSTVKYPTFDLNVAYKGLVLAPDGRTIAFETTREGCPGIWGMGVDGTGLRKLSIGAYAATRCNHFPFFSPDGSLIAFTTSREGRWSVYVMNADGTNPRNVSSPLDQVTDFLWPTGWTPEGLVVFEYRPLGGSQAYTVKPDGTNRELLFGRVGDHSPWWSPDRAKVAFIRDTPNGSSLHLMNADGTDVRRLTNHAGRDEFSFEEFATGHSPWSRDGRRIVYLNSIEGRNELRVIDADGTRDVRLTDYSANFNGWAPDGRITFSSTKNGSSDIYLIEPGGTGLVNLTSTSGSNEMRALWVRRW